MTRWLLLASLALPLPTRAEVRFENTVPASVPGQPITGRLYVMISHTKDEEPRLQISQTGGTPFFGRDIEELAPGEAAVIDASDLGSPVPSLTEIPPGDYFAQDRARQAGGASAGDGPIYSEDPAKRRDDVVVELLR